MESVKALIEILKSQETLYTEMRDILEAEKECVVTWNAEKTIDLVKKKDTLAYKEKVLDEAFRTCLKKIEKEEDHEGLKVSDVVELYAGDDADDLSGVRKRLIKLVDEIKDINISLKILYKTNISLIDGVFSKLGIAGSNTYGLNRGYNNSRTSTISRTG